VLRVYSELADVLDCNAIVIGDGVDFVGEAMVRFAMGGGRSVVGSTGAALVVAARPVAVLDRGRMATTGQDSVVRLRLARPRTGGRMLNGMRRARTAYPPLSA